MLGQAIIGIAAVGLALPGVFAQNCTALTPVAEPVVAEGYEARVILNNLKSPRDLIVDGEGNLLLAQQGGVGISRVVLEETANGTVCVASNDVLISDATLNHGIALTPDGSTLFVSKPSSVEAYPYDAAAGIVGAKRTVIGGMASTGHITRTLLVPAAAPDLLFVTRGSNANIDNGTTETGAARSILKAFNILSELLAVNQTEPVDFAAGGQVVGWGLRNSAGLGEDPATGGIWTVENSADEVHRSGVDLHNSNPGEELNYHGVAGDAANALLGANYGYPVCYAAWNTTDIPEGDGITIGSQFGGVDGTPFEEVVASKSAGKAATLAEIDDFCRAERQGPRLVFPAHTAPLDVKFRPDGSAAFVTFHGSWNKDPPDGYRLGRIEFKDGQPVAGATDTDAVDYIVRNQDSATCPGDCFRPVGLAFDVKGRLYMTSDATGELFVITGG